VRIGIVIASFNEGQTLPQAVQHLLTTSTVDRVVVVDASNASESKLCAQAFSDEAGALWGSRLRMITEAPTGRARQMNIGAECLDTDIVLFLHVDTRLPAEAMDALREQANGRFQWGRFDVRIDDGHWTFRMIETAMNLRSYLTGICTGDQCIFVSKSLFSKTGGYSPIALMEDIDLSRRLKKHCAPVVLPYRVLTSSRRWRHYGILRTMVLMWWLRLAYWLGVKPDRLARWYRSSND